MKKVVNIINWNEVMETVRVWLENIIIGMGFRGGIVPVLRHLLLILFAALVAWLSYALCRWLFTPLVNRLTSHSKSKWDHVLLG